MTFIENSKSELNDKDVIMVGLDLRNLMDDVNMLDANDVLNKYGTDDEECPNITFFFLGVLTSSTEKLSSGGFCEIDLPILYKQNGEYKIVIDNDSKHYTMTFDNT